MQAEFHEASAELSPVSTANLAREVLQLAALLSLPDQQAADLQLHPDAPAAESIASCTRVIADIRRALTDQRASERSALIGVAECSAELISRCRTVAPQVALAAAGMAVTREEEAPHAPLSVLVEDAVNCTVALSSSHSVLLELLEDLREEKHSGTETNTVVFPQLASATWDGSTQRMPGAGHNVATRRHGAKILHKRFQGPDPRRERKHTHGRAATMPPQRSASTELRRAPSVLLELELQERQQQAYQRPLEASLRPAGGKLPGPLRQLGEVSAGRSSHPVRMSRSRQAQLQWAAESHFGADL